MIIIMLVCVFSIACLFVLSTISSGWMVLGHLSTFLIPANVSIWAMLGFVSFRMCRSVCVCVCVCVCLCLCVSVFACVCMHYW